MQHHDSRTQIHITINTVKILERCGWGNHPYVFRARGLYSLSGEWADKDDPTISLSVDAWNEVPGMTELGAMDKFVRQFGEINETAEDVGDETVRWCFGLFFLNVHSCHDVFIANVCPDSRSLRILRCRLLHAVL
jgi:hypothetical protein